MINFTNKKKREYIEQLIRVNHAGEYGAKRIYQGQLSVLKDNKEIRHMYEQELKHLAFFESEIVERRIRPTILSPIWHYGGYFLGFITAKLGVSTAMACTEAVEDIIEGHYDEQINKIPDNENELKAKIEQFQAEEIEHRNTAISAGAKNAQLYPITTSIIKSITKFAIKLSKKY